MKKPEIISNIATAANVTKADAERVYAALTKLVGEQVKSAGSIKLPDLGTFKKSERAARKGRNPQTKAEIEIPATTTVTFKAAKALKDQVK